MTFLTAKTTPTYRAAIHALVARKQPLKIAVAFWGLESTKLLTPKQSRARIICNLESGATNPYAIQEILNRHDVRTLNNLHAKVLLTKGEAIVGSANLSANGLNFEDGETTAWLEAGILVDDEAVLGAIDAWFESLWKEAYAIDDELLNSAKLTWGQRRNLRPLNAPPKVKLYEALTSDSKNFKDRKSYLVMVRPEELSLRIQQADSIDSKETGTHISSFEGWKSLPEDSELISYFYDPKKPTAPELDGIWQSLSHSRVGPLWRLPCREEKTICGINFSTDDRKFFASKVPALWRDKNARGDSKGKFISLFDVAQHLQSSANNEH